MTNKVRVTTGYKPRPLQKAIHKSLKRWNVLVCHRRFGKSVMSINQLIHSALSFKGKNGRFAYLAPTYTQGKTIAWDYLKEFSQPVPGTKANESELRVDFPNGSRVRIFGCDRPDALRGIYLDGVVLDEYAQMPANLFGEVVRPSLSDRKGYAIWIGTPQGKNAFYDLYRQADGRSEWFTAMYKASDTGILDKDELKDAQSIMTSDEYEQEYECSWQASIKGAYYAKWMNEADKEGRITSVPYDPALAVHTAWDLGVGDATAIWFFQAYGRELRIIDYYEASGEGLPYYAKILQERGYVYGDHYAPHDIAVRELGSGRSRKEIALNLGIRFQVVAKQSIDDGIEAVRSVLPRCYFDSEKARQGIDSLIHYHKEFDQKRGEFKNRPYHDWSSHASDAFRYLAVGFKDSTEQFESYEPEAVNYY